LEGVQINLHSDLIQKCIDGERNAHNELYKMYSKAMFNICYRISNDYDDAEDILQDAFISAFRSLHTFKGTASFGAWLKRIVVNKAINHIKKRKLELAPLEDVELNVTEDEFDDENIILNVEKIKTAVQLLPDGYRVVFSLYLLEGYDHKEIADILEITESTSKSQYNRAKKKLREILKEEATYER